MIRSFVRAVTLGAATLGALCVTQAASATAFTFNFTNQGASATSGNKIDYVTTAGGATTFGNATTSSQLGLDVYGGHINTLGTSGRSTVSGATVAAYQGAGLGVLFGSDTTNDGTHQMDNVGGGSDFVALVFDQAVTLSSIFRTNYSGNYRNPGTGTDTDASFMAYTGTLSDLSTGGVNLANFSSILDSNTSTGATATSKIWLVAAYTGGQTNDAFKLKSITVNTPNAPGPVPEPATWAMMLVGFGAIGYGMRRRRVDVTAAA